MHIESLLLLWKWNNYSLNKTFIIGGIIWNQIYVDNLYVMLFCMIEEDEKK